MFALGIDSSTQGTKAVVYDVDAGKVVAPGEYTVFAGGGQPGFAPVQSAKVWEGN